MMNTTATLGTVTTEKRETREERSDLEDKVTETTEPSIHKSCRYLFLEEPLLYKGLIKLKKGTPIQRTLTYPLGFAAYAIAGTALTFPLGNVLPCELQRKELERQGRNKLTYSIWGLITDTAWQGAKLWGMMEAASTETNLGYGVASTLGAWTLYKAVEIPARAGLIAWRKEPIPFLILEGTYQGFIKARKGIQRLNPALRITDTIKSARKLYSSKK